MNRTAVLALSLIAIHTGASAQELRLVRADDALPVTSAIEGMDEDLVRDRLSAAHELSFQMEAEVDRLRMEIAEAKAAVEVKKSEIDIIETQKDLADDQDRDDEKRALERDKDFEEAVKKVLERTVELRERELGHVEARRETAQAAATVHERELELIGSRDEMSGRATSRSMEQALRLEREIMSLERELLESLRDRAGKSRQEADRERQVYEAQLRVLDAQRELGEVER